MNPGIERAAGMPPSEFSRVVGVTRLGDGGVVHRMVASDEERRLLARRFGIVALDRFVAEVRLTREPAGGVRLEAEIEADIVQDCVVTLEPFASHLGDRAAIVYRRQAPRHGEPVDVGEDDVEPLDGDEIDIGEAVAQQLSLALDPFPRAPAAALPDLAQSPEEQAAAPVLHPFAELAKLAKK